MKKLKLCAPSKAIQKIQTLFFFLLFTTHISMGQLLDFTAVEAEVDFSDKLQHWDGFGFNYVETAHTYDYEDFTQEYGGFSLLSEVDKQTILDMVFGEDGLKPGLIKMFLDPLQQQTPGGVYDHESTTQNMRYFVREGLKITRERGADLSIITTLYGPPAWATIQNVPRGRDLNPSMTNEVADYMVDWVKYLVNQEKFPIHYLSIHNEGEDWSRWNTKGYTDWHGHDYNMYWSPELVIEYLKILPDKLKSAGVGQVGVTPGETTNWHRFSAWGYADAIAKDKKAMQNMALITSHGFYKGEYGRWFGDHRNDGIRLLQDKKPGLKAWVTSTSWSKMDAFNVKEMHGNIYTAKVNGIIPWAGIQRPPHWLGGDPNPGSAFTVKEDGSFEVQRGYYYYKQLTRAGQPGMVVVNTMAMDSEIAIIGFGANGTKNKDAFIVANISGNDREIAIRINGIQSKKFTAFRTVERPNRYRNIDRDLYSPIGTIEVNNKLLIYTAPAGSVTTFYSE